MGSMEWIHFFQYMDKWRGVEYTVRKIRFHKMQKIS